MAKKILILNGSPRANGNTATLIDAFTEGAQSAGHTITRFDLRSMKVCELQYNPDGTIRTISGETR